jgi:uncharacterized membrane protein YsdA (DUF1294 family)
MQMDSITRERGVKLKSGRGQKLMESFRVKSKTKNLRSFFCYPITNKKPRLSLVEERTNERTNERTILVLSFPINQFGFWSSSALWSEKTKKDESSYPPDVV